MKTDSRGAFTRIAGSVLLWVLALVGAVSGVLWAANQAGLVQPLIIVSGSMAPEINTGDLVVATPTPARDLEIGQVATLPSSVDDVLVTHRIVELDRSGDTITVRMQGDANLTADGEQHVLGADDPVWTHRMTIPGAGYVLETLMRPAVAIPIGVGLLAAVIVTQLPGRRNDDDTQDAPATLVADKEEVLA